METVHRRQLGHQFAGGRNGRGNLARDQFAEVQITVVEVQARTKPEHQESGELVRDVRANRQHDRRLWRIRPRSGRHARQLPLQVFDDLHGFSTNCLG